MELMNEKTMLQTRKTTQFMIQKPDMTKLKAYATELPDGSRDVLKGRYGNLLDLLDVNVQTDAISAMAQYYDSPFRCFTFSNFQLAPTLEEFSVILGQPLNDGKPYHFYGSYPRVNTVAKALGVDPNDINNKKPDEKTVEGIPRVRVEELMHKLMRRGDWGILIDVLALAIYDLILFPSSGDFVGPGAIDVFMARKCRRENSTFPILADVYYTLSLCHEERKKKIICCLPILYIWLTAHVLRRNFNNWCPISDWKMLGSQIYSAREWRQKFIELTEDSVRWFPLAGGVKRVVFSCGDFPNVPLVGTSECINYNPILALRQVRYPITSPPTEESLFRFRTVLTDRPMLDRISKAWNKVTYIGSKELGNKSCGASDTYKEWVRDRVEVIKLPFQSSTPRPQQETDTVLEESDEMRIMKDELARSKGEKSALEAELKEVRVTLESLRLECKEKSRSLEQANKRARTEKNSKDKTRTYLSSANQDLKMQIAEHDKTMKENERLRLVLREKEYQMDTLKAQTDELVAQHDVDKRFKERTHTEIIREYQDHLEEKHREMKELLKLKEDVLEENWRLKGEMVNLEAVHDLKLKETIAQYEEKIRKDNLEVRSVIHMYRATIDRKNEELRALGNWPIERNNLLGLIREAELNHMHAWYEVGRWARKLREVERIPELVRDAEATANPLTTPREAVELINVCKGLVEDFEELVMQAMNN